MEDKELYDFFKTRSSSFNEAPGDALWAKIETGLGNTQGVKAEKPWFIILLVGIVSVITIVIASVVISTLKNTKLPVDNRQNTINTTKDALNTVTPQVKNLPLTTQQNNLNTVIDTIDKNRIYSVAKPIFVNSLDPAGQVVTMVLKDTATVIQQNLRLNNSKVQPQNIKFSIARDSLKPQPLHFAINDSMLKNISKPSSGINNDSLHIHFKNK